MTRRDDLSQTFLADADDAGHPITTHADQLDADLIMDGDQYFTEVFNAISGTTSGDEVMLVGWTFLTSMSRAAAEIGDLLAAKQLGGVNVYLVLNGSQYQNHGGTPFQECLEASIDMRERRIPPGATTPPLEQRVMFDFSGAGLTGSHHQKTVIVRQGTDSVAYVGGLDMTTTRDDTNDHPGMKTKDHPPSWGWHDAAIRLRGDPVGDVWANFISRWKETQTLPVRNAWRWLPGTGGPPLKLKPYNPSPGATAPVAPTAFLATNPNNDIAVQVLRSRFPIKLPRERPPLDWAFPPLGGIRQVQATMRKAIGAAQRYIYIEDQFIADTFDSDDGAARAYSLLPALFAAANRGVKVILLTSGVPDGPSFGAIPPSTMQNQVIDKLPAATKANVSIWKLTTLMVHTKLMLIDDVFCSVGSANLHSRSMYGIDQELHVALVDAAVDAAGQPAGAVRDWRVRVWAEHLEIIHSYTNVLPQLQDLDLALGMWRQSWRVGGTQGMWFASDNPAGFQPAKVRRTFVSPPPQEP